MRITGLAQLPNAPNFSTAHLGTAVRRALIPFGELAHAPDKRHRAIVGHLSPTKLQADFAGREAFGQTFQHQYAAREDSRSIVTFDRVEQPLQVESQIRPPNFLTVNVHVTALTEEVEHVILLVFLAIVEKRKITGAKFPLYPLVFLITPR